MKRLVLLISVLLCLMVPAQEKDVEPSLVDEGKIKIDGSSSDWSGIKAIFSEFGKSGVAAGFADVKEFKMAYSKSAFYFSASVKPEFSKYEPGENEQSILHFSFDIDDSSSTGIPATKYLTLKQSLYKGYEHRFELVKIKGKETVGRLFSNDNGFKEPVAEWKSGDANFNIEGETVEIQIPYELLKFDGTGKIKFMFVEIGNKEVKDGFMLKRFPIDTTTPAAVAGNDGESSESGGFSIWHLMLITIWVVGILTGFAIAPKAGLSGGLAAVNLLPFLGQIIFLFILAFGNWPLHKDYQKLEDIISDYEEGGL